MIKVNRNIVKICCALSGSLCILGLNATSAWASTVSTWGAGCSSVEAHLDAGIKLRDLCPSPKKLSGISCGTPSEFTGVLSDCPTIFVVSCSGECTTPEEKHYSNGLEDPVR